MKYLAFFLISFSITITAKAQLDGSVGGNDKGKTSVGILTTPSKEVEQPKSLDFSNDQGFKTAHQKQQETEKKKQQEREFENKGIITPALQRKLTLQKKMEKYGFEIPMIDKDLGSFRTKSDKINIEAYDFGYLDGDVVNIYNNGKLIFSNYTLTKSIKVLRVPLTIGFNKVEIVAINEGKLRPNTGAFTVYDGSKDIVISDMWQLAKGAKVTALVIREE